MDIDAFIAPYQAVSVILMFGRLFLSEMAVLKMTLLVRGINVYENMDL